MPALALALVLAAAVLHAAWNVAAKRAGGDSRFAALCSVLSAVLWLPAGLWFGWSAVPLWGAAEWAVVSASALVHLAYFQALLAGYRAADLTVVYPVARGSGPLLTALAAVLWLGESLSWFAMAGVAAVCGGVFLLAGGPRLFSRAADPSVRAGLRWGALTGCLIAGYSVIDGVAIKVLLIGPVLLDYAGNLLRLPVLLPLLWRRPGGGLRALWSAQWKAALVVSTLGPLAYILVLYALQIAPLSHVAPAREVSMLFAALLGGRLLGEQDRGLRLAGACCIACGVMALAIS